MDEFDDLSFLDNLENFGPSNEDDAEIQSILTGDYIPQSVMEKNPLETDETKEDFLGYTKDIQVMQERFKESFSKKLSSTSFFDNEAVEDSEKPFVNFRKNAQILELGIEKIWKEDVEYQVKAIQKVLEEQRKIKDQEYLLDYMEYLCNMGAFFVPDSGYMIDMFGEEITLDSYGVYKYGTECRYTDKLCLPIRFLDGYVVGFVGYSPVTETNPTKYLYPESTTLRKSVVLFCQPEEFRQSLREEYVVLTDGLFDAISLGVLGINSASLCGSAITDFHKLALSKIKTKIIAFDNDTAGRKLFGKGKELLSNCKGIMQPFTNDLDDFLKDKARREDFLNKFEVWKRNNFLGNLRLGGEVKFESR